MTANPNDILDYSPPPLKQVQKALRLHTTYFDPVFYGMENLNKDKPALYVANHTIYGTLDGPLLFLALYQEKDIILRSLGDRFHFKIPGWKKMMLDGGCVEGTRENCQHLMEHNNHILVYPGGGREVAKRRGEEYKLIWKTRTGFARMAMQNGYPIIPVACLGADDAYDIHYDALDFKASKLGQKILENPKLNELLRNGDTIMPLATGIGFTPLPRPERFYFSFGKPIETEPFQSVADNKEKQWQVRKQVMESLETELENLKTIIYKDRDLSLVSKLFSRH